jgi:hypothetical protein
MLWAILPAWLRNSMWSVFIPSAIALMPRTDRGKHRSKPCYEDLIFLQIAKYARDSPRSHATTRTILVMVEGTTVKLLQARTSWCGCCSSLLKAFWEAYCRAEARPWGYCNRFAVYGFDWRFHRDLISKHLPHHRSSWPWGIIKPESSSDSCSQARLHATQYDIRPPNYQFLGHASILMREWKVPCSLRSAWENNPIHIDGDNVSGGAFWRRFLVVV